MFIIIKQDSNDKLKLIGEFIENQATAFSTAKFIAFKGADGDVIHLCEVVARMQTKLMIEDVPHAAPESKTYTASNEPTK